MSCSEFLRRIRPQAFVWRCVVALSVFITLGVANAQSRNATESSTLRGLYIMEGGASPTMALACISNSACVLTNLRSANGIQSADSQTFANVLPLSDLSQVAFAYNYAKERSKNKPLDPRSVELWRQLGPLFAQEWIPNDCVDLDPKQPKYFVACKLTSSPWGRPAVILFVSLLANCGSDFCRFVFFPLVEVNNASK